MAAAAARHPALTAAEAALVATLALLIAVTLNQVSMSSMTPRFITFVCILFIYTVVIALHLETVVLFQHTGKKCISNILCL